MAVIDPIQFIVNERGERTSAIIRIDVYRHMLEKLGKPGDLRELDEQLARAKRSRG
jgi:hypothetical protein